MDIDSMKIKIKIFPQKSSKEIDLIPGSKVYDILEKIQLKPDTIIVLEDNIPIPFDDLLREGQEINILKVTSGG